VDYFFWTLFDQRPDSKFFDGGKSSSRTASNLLPVVFLYRLPSVSFLGVGKRLAEVTWIRRLCRRWRSPYG
jgi:hypothetical protein